MTAIAKAPETVIQNIYVYARIKVNGCFLCLGSDSENIRTNRERHLKRERERERERDLEREKEREREIAKPEICN